MTIKRLTPNAYHVSYRGFEKTFVSATFATMVLWARAIEKSLNQKLTDRINSLMYGNK